MDYFKNIEGLLEPAEDNIEDIERKTEKSYSSEESKTDNDSFVEKLASLSQDDIIEIAKQYLESLNTLSSLVAIGEDGSEALSILKSRLDACLKCITDSEIKKEILSAMKKAFDNDALEHKTSRGK